MGLHVSRIWCLALVLGIAAVAGLHAQQPPITSPTLTPVPRLVWLNGVFQPADHQPVAPVESVTVSVYREREGGDALWRESQNVRMAADGRYSLLLGSTLADGLPLALFTSGEPRWIGISVNRPGEAEQPRVHLARAVCAESGGCRHAGRSARVGLRVGRVSARSHDTPRVGSRIDPCD